MSRRDCTIVAWHAGPGTAYPQTSRPVGYGMQFGHPLRTAERSLQFGHLQGRYGIAVGQYGASGSGGLNHGWVADNVGRGALGEGFSFNLLTEQGNQILAGGTPSAKAPLR